MSGKSPQDASDTEDAEQPWREEIERRIVSIENGTAALVPWAEVYARPNRRFQR
jgi:hypothetical protein